MCGSHGALYRLDEDKIIIGGNIDGIMKIISISKKEIIKEINNTFQCWGIYLIEDKGIFLIGGRSKDIRIYRNDNYECIQTIKDAHNENIKGFIELKDVTIASFSNDKINNLFLYDSKFQIFIIISSEKDAIEESFISINPLISFL